MAVRSKKALGTKASYPGFIEPALASSLDKVPDGARWIHEIKFDGYRVQVHLYDGQVKVSTRRGNDWTKRLRFFVFGQRAVRWTEYVADIIFAFAHDMTFRPA